MATLFVYGAVASGAVARIPVDGIPLAAGHHREPARPDLAPWLDTTDRAIVARAYDAAFSAEVPALEWTGNRDDCDPGSSSPAYRSATIDRVNFYRAMAGVTAKVTERSAFSVKAQRAAMMMSAEGELTHTPPKSFACFTLIGQEAAANSNLYLGRNGPEAIDGYIEDPGDRNADVGHRNTILHPPTEQMGVGDVGGSTGGYSANALWVFDDRVFDQEASSRQPEMREVDRFVAWPPRGFVPSPLIHPRWSFTLAGVDVSRAEVAMFIPAAPPGHQRVALRVVSRTGAPGHVPLPTVVWEPETVPEADVDTYYLVVLTGIEPEQSILAAAVPSAAKPGLDPAGPSTPPPAGQTHNRLAYSYTVRVMGAEPSGQLTVEEMLGRIRSSQAEGPVSRGLGSRGLGSQGNTGF